LKSEARILVSTCDSGGCLAVILRGNGVDGAAYAGSCASLCMRVAEKGYMGELRYSIGDCTCGLPRPPRVGGYVASYSTVLREILREIPALAAMLEAVEGHGVPDSKQPPPIDEEWG